MFLNKLALAALAVASWACVAEAARSEMSSGKQDVLSQTSRHSIVELNQMNLSSQVQRMQKASVREYELSYSERSEYVGKAVLAGRQQITKWVLAIASFVSKTPRHSFSEFEAQKWQWR